MSIILQNDLVSLGYGGIMGGIDGIVGQRTTEAVKELQKDSGLVVDGIAGVKTKAVMLKWKKNAGTMGTKNFSINEFRSPDDRSLPKRGMDPQLLLKLEWLRWRCGNRPMKINSGYRTVAFNKKVGGIQSSNHLTGKAADVKVIGMDADLVHKEALRLFEGVGKYRNFTHVDTDKKRIKYVGKY